MKTSILTVVALTICLIASAQSNNDYLELARDAIKVEKKAAITEAMQLTEAESQPFWSLYNEYESKLYPIQNKRIDLIKTYAERYEMLTNDKADELWTNYMSYQKELLTVKSTYYKKFKKILSPGKAVRFMQTENKIETLINAQLALEIPLVETVR
ncbi:MAG: hypothetical protein RIB47_13830 [Cyclobacteriaceae bacterium]